LQELQRDTNSICNIFYNVPSQWYVVRYAGQGQRPRCDAVLSSYLRSFSTLPPLSVHSFSMDAVWILSGCYKDGASLGYSRRGPPIRYLDYFPKRTDNKTVESSCLRAFVAIHHRSLRRILSKKSDS